MQEVQTLLNFQQILQQVKHFFVFDMSNDYASVYLTVETSYEVVRALQQYTETFYLNQAKFDVPHVSPLRSFKTIQQKLTTEAMLEAKEALQIANLYDNVQTIQQFYAKHADELINYEQLKKLMTVFIVNKPLVKEVRRVITEDGLIADDASPMLASLRQEQRQIEQSIRQTLQRIMQTEKNKLAEQLYTLRNNRYVLPIKAEFKNNFPGILHDQSASGTTAYIEPQKLVQINNTLQQLMIEEERECERLLLELSERLFQFKHEIADNANCLARFDIYQAKAKHAASNDFIKVEIINEQKIELYNAQHPLLQNERTVGNDILLGEDYTVLMVTGANTGGKSVFLKMIGLLSLMAQAGLFLPVERDQDNRIGVFKEIFIDIGDEQSLEQNLSTFSGHIKNIKQIVTQSDPRLLVLLDELGSGTDPIQGAALAIAIVDALAEKGTLVVGTTHFNEVKEYMLQAPYGENAAMVFDMKALKPTYKLRYGSYGASYAFDIAQALAFPEAIIMDARKRAAAFTNDSGALLATYEQRLEALDAWSKQLEAQTRTLEEQERILAQKRASDAQLLEQERQAFIAAAEKELAQKRKQVNALLEELKTTKTLKQNEYAALKGKINALDEAPKNQLKKQARKRVQAEQALKENDIVYIESLQSHGTLLKKQGKKWLVKVGNLSLTLAAAELVFVKTTPEKKQVVKGVRKKMRTVPSTLDLRGVRVAEGIEMLEIYLANAASVHQHVQIIHGHGTGQMRTAVQEVLRRTKSVKSFRFGGVGEGGVGVTVVEFGVSS